MPKQIQKLRVGVVVADAYVRPRSYGALRRDSFNDIRHDLNTDAVTNSHRTRYLIRWVRSRTPGIPQRNHQQDKHVLNPMIHHSAFIIHYSSLRSYTPTSFSAGTLFASSMTIRMRSVVVSSTCRIRL